MSLENISYIETWIVLLVGYTIFRTFEFAIRRNIKFIKGTTKNEQ